jgi:hypothetical protein
MAPDSGADDLISGLDVPFGDHAQVEARPVVGDEERRKFGLAEPHADPEAGDPRLGDLELGLADAVPVADANVGVAEPVDGEVLPELAVFRQPAAEVGFPVAVGLDLVDEHGALLAAVPVQVTLPVVVDVQPAHKLRSGYRTLPDPGVDGATPPADVLR